MDYLAQRRRWSRSSAERTLFLPAHKGVVAKGGLKWVTKDKNVGPALDKFVKASGPDPAGGADALPAWKWARRLLRRAGDP